MHSVFSMTELCFGFVKQFADISGNPYNLKPWGETPEWQRRMILSMADYVVSTGSKAPGMHDHWYNGWIQQGWTYGEKYDPVKKESPILLSWGELPDPIKLYEIFFVTELNGLIQHLNSKPQGTLWDIVRISDVMVRAYDAFNMERSDTYFTRMWEKTNVDIDWVRNWVIDTTNNDISRSYGISMT